MRATLAILLLLASASACADVDWAQAVQQGIQQDGETAYGGCVPAYRPQARKAAILKAQANLARARGSILVSGEEHVAGSNYRMRVTETAGTYLGQIEVIKEEVIESEEAARYCVLVVDHG